MTFKVVSIGESHEQVVGTVWADAESQAEVLALSLFGTCDGAGVRVRRTDDREIPMRLAEPAYTSPFLS